jgi:tetratricopeptide (TPR) repeat protein
MRNEWDDRGKMADGRGSDPLRRILPILLIVSLGLVAYANSMSVPFQFDDIDAIVKNRRVHETGGVAGLFTHPRGIIGARPLTLLTLALNYRAGGLDTAGYHAFNIALHIGCALLLYALIAVTGRLMGARRDPTDWTALLAAALFAAHPLHTETVTYIVSRSMLLATACYMMGILLFVRAVGTGRIGYTAGLVAVALMGVSSRENFVTFPLILVLYDYVFIVRGRARALLSHAPQYAALALPLLYLAFLVSHQTYDSAGFGGSEISPLTYFFTQTGVQLYYLKLVALPLNLVLDYGYPVLETQPLALAVLACLGYVGLWGLALHMLRQHPHVAFGLLWYLVTITPDSSVVPLDDVIFEHRAYLPSVGVIALCAAGLVAAHSRLRPTPGGPAALAALSVAMVATFTVATIERNTDWRSRLSLWEDTAAKAPGNMRAAFNMGRAHEEDGDAWEAVESYKRAVLLDPEFPGARINLARLYGGLGMYDKAIEQYEHVLGAAPDPRIHASLGAVYASVEMIDRAIAHCEIAVALEPSLYEAHFNLGMGYLRKNLAGKARSAFATALALRPDDFDARYNIMRIDQGFI